MLLGLLGGFLVPFLSLFFFSPLKGAPELKSLLVGVGQKVQKLCNIKLRPRQF